MHVFLPKLRSLIDSLQAIISSTSEHKHESNQSQGKTGHKVIKEAYFKHKKNLRSLQMF